MDNHTTTNAVVERERNKMQGPPLQWSVVSKKLHMRIKDAAAELNISESFLRRLCKKNGIPKWPGKRIRFMNGTVRLALMLGVAAPEDLPCAGLAGPSQPAKVAKTKKKAEEEKDITGIHNKPAANHPPREELVTLNLLDKVGLSSASGNGN